MAWAEATRAPDDERLKDAVKNGRGKNECRDSAFNLYLKRGKDIADIGQNIVFCDFRMHNENIRCFW